VGGAPDAWAIDPEISTTIPGLSFNTATGEITGTPTGIHSATAFTVWANNSADDISTTISITVQDEAADISYAGSPFTFTKNSLVSGVTPTNVGGAPDAWAIDPEISTTIPGLSFNTATGEITGTPTGVHSSATFTVWANNSASDISTTISITVNDIAPVFTYTSLEMTLTNNSVVSFSPINTGGAVTSWEFIGTEPLGLNFEGGNGTIWGTPTVVQSKTQYLIWGNNSGGQYLVYMNITISDVPVSLSSTSDNYNLTRNVMMATPISPVYTGIVETWGIEPSPALVGLSWDSSTGVISGTPNINMTRTEYTLWANNTGGDVPHKFNITINEPVVNLAYSPAAQTFVRSTAITSWHPTVTGGNVETWDIEPLLAGTGLSFVNGVISGTPSINMTQTDYVVWANTTGGETNFTITITINEPVVNLAYSPAAQTFVRSTAITSWHATVTGGNVETWGIEPSLAGTGLSFVNGVISGTPSINMTQTDYVVWANTTGGETNFTITITINEPGVILDYIPENVIVTIGDPMTALTPLVSNGSVEEWSIYPELDNGLDFTNGIISGTPTSIQSKQTYKIWANNTGGNTYHDVNITILDIAPEVSYSLASVVMTNDTLSSDLPLHPSNLGGPVVTWSITPGLSLGLSFDQATGVISGTPIEVMALRVYTVTATNTGGPITVDIEITVLDQVPMVAYVPSEEVLLLDESVLNMVPESTGGAITLWSITPEPSAGLLFDESTGVLSGTPTETMIRTQYEITAINDVGTMAVSINITVEDLNYNLELGPIYLLKNEEMLSLEPTSTLSGAVYEVSPDLPDGLFLGESNGTIWGTPIVGMPLTNFTIYANSSLFNDVLVVQIGVLEDSDSDGMPNELPLGYNPLGGLTEDLDDDGDGFTDVDELTCETDPLDATSVISDLDGDSICDALDDDVDGDGLLNDVETNTSTYVDENDTGTQSGNADTDGDGVCDGPQVPANGGCTAGPDVFPFDPAGSIDSDGDGMPDTLNGESTSTPPLVEDLDDDNDAWSDEMEAACETDSVDSSSVPGDEDGDGICDSLDTNLDLPFNLTYPTDTLTLTLGEEISILLPNLTGLGEVSSWEIIGELPDGLTFGWSPARDAALDGSIRGTPTEAMPATVFTIWANNSAYSQSFELTITVLEELTDSDEDDDSINWGYICCFPLILLLLLCLLFVFVFGEKNVLIDAEPSNTLVKSWSGVGVGTQEDPLVLKSVRGIKSGSFTNSHETITFTGLTVESIELVDFNEEKNGRKFSMSVPNVSEASTRMVAVDEDEPTTITMLFNDGEGEPTLEGGEFTAMLKIGNSSVYFSWTVSVEAQTEKDVANNAHPKQVNASQTIGEDRKKGFSIKEQMALEQKAAEKAKQQADADAKAAKEAKAEADAEMKAAKEIEAQANQKAKTVEQARAQVDADAAALAKKAEELERIAKRAKTIDFATLGVATVGEKDDLQAIKGVGPFIAEKLNALGIFTFEQVGNMTAEIEEQVNIAIEFFPGRIKRDEWAKQAKEIYESKKKF
ncbi:putative Ig domain-containing protein, partial [Candidatus Poseidoniales archaeon]|nr:putative Ig domain-containing protein [Candidatus Poseidoniales archaeon]